MHPKTLSPVHALPQPRYKVLGKGLCILKQGSWKTDLIPLSHTHAYTYTTLHWRSACSPVPRPAQLAATRDSGAEPSSRLLCSPKAAGNVPVWDVPLPSFWSWRMMAPLLSLT